MILTLRQNQVDIIDRVRRAFSKGIKGVCVVFPTGGGKTVIFCFITKAVLSKGNSVIILVHRRELILQISSHLDFLGIVHGIIAPGFPMTDHKVQTASVQTLKNRIESVPVPNLVIIDECQHVAAKTWENILSYWTKTAPDCGNRHEGGSADDLRPAALKAEPCISSE